MILGFDTETHLIRRGYTVPRLVCASVAVRTTDLDEGDELFDAGPSVLVGTSGACTWYLLDHGAAASAWPALLDHDLVMHNSAFDLQVMMAATGLVGETLDAVGCDRVWDTMLREKLHALSIGELRFRHDPVSGKLSPSRYRLADLVMRYFGIDLSAAKGPAAWRTRYSELDGVPLAYWPGEAADYAAEDAVWALRVAEVQEDHPDIVDGMDAREAGATGRLRRFAGEAREVRAALALGLGASWGLRTDPVQVDRTIADWTARSEAGVGLGRAAGFIRTALNKRSGEPTKKDGTKDLAVLGGMVEVAYASRGVPVPLTPTGRIRTSEAVLRDSGDPVLEEYALSLSATNWLGKYAPILRAGTIVPITYGVDTLKSTGRLSLRNPPLHQPPREGGFRECFVPRPGHVYISADYDQIELRALAQLHIWLGLGDTLARAFRAGHDPHVMMAADILVAEMHETPHLGPWTAALVERCLAGEHGVEWRAVAKAYRQLAKAANFGFPGGLGPDAFVNYAHTAYGVDIDADRAIDLKQTWLRRWPEMIGYFAHINAMLRYGDSFTARQSVSQRLRGGCGYCDGANTYFQGLVADGFKGAAWAMAVEMYARPESALYGSRMVLPLHDEFVVEAPGDSAGLAAARLVEVMIAEMGRHMPDVPVTTEAAMMRRWYKGAEPRYDAAGRLIPWEPEV